jgi:hypothetical protein
MKLFSLILALFAALPALHACPFSKTRWSNGNGSVNRRASDTLDDYYAYAPNWWPRNKDNKATIRYCFNMPQDREQFASRFEAAIAMWINALEGPASEETGHSLDFEEASDGNTKLYCEDKSARNQWKWNDKVEWHTLRISLVDNIEVAGSSTSGYISGGNDDEHMDRPGLNTMKLGVACDVVNIAHELGHTMGMAHEHVREDRK